MGYLIAGGAPPKVPRAGGAAADGGGGGLAGTLREVAAVADSVGGLRQAGGGGRGGTGDGLSKVLATMAIAAPIVGAGAKVVESFYPFFRSAADRKAAERAEVRAHWERLAGGLRPRPQLGAMRRLCTRDGAECVQVSVQGGEVTTKDGTTLERCRETTEGRLVCDWRGKEWSES